MVEKQLVQCHYEVLGIETDENTAGIKKSHRKLALKYHPDKNLGDDDAATKFMLIQQAYEVLSGKFQNYLFLFKETTYS